ncbi:hypothetical protein K2X05_08660 [bacterium]|nr:hypothetical protein [bacterium]
MRSLLLLLSLLVTGSAFAASYEGPISQADFLTQQRLVTYLEKDMGQPIKNISEILDAVDEDYVEVSRVKINNQIYEMVLVWSGDNAHGAVFNPGTLDMVGYNSDGDVFMYSGNSEDGEWVADVEFLD